jgi:tetratricopeptide (TPR) repeat protein
VGEYPFDTVRVKRLWDRLHAGDAEPCPSQPSVLLAWGYFHSGDFQRAAETGLSAGAAGLTVANKATSTYANYLEKKERTRLDLFMQVAQRAQAQTLAEPENANAWYQHAYALGRYSQCINVAKALAQGLGSKVKTSLEKTIELQPRHADAHVALAAFHAEVIDKVGTLIAGMTYGAKKEVGLKLFEQALDLTPGSAIAMIEYAHGLIMLEGEQKFQEATGLYERAVACQPLDAAERLAVELARTELAD